MRLGVQNAFDERVELVEFLKLHVHLLRESELASSKIPFNGWKPSTHFMELILKLESAATCCADCRQQLCHWDGNERNNLALIYIPTSATTRHLLPFDLASCRKLPISAVGKRMKWSEPFLSRISTLSSWNRIQMSYKLVHCGTSKESRTTAN